MKEKLPNSTASLVLGIFSIVTCFCYGLPGIILGVIGLILGNKAIKLDNEDPDLYEGVGNAKAGKIISIIGLVLSVIVVALMAYGISLIGWEALQNPELMQERLRELQEATENQ